MYYSPHDDIVKDGMHCFTVAWQCCMHLQPCGSNIAMTSAPSQGL